MNKDNKILIFGSVGCHLFTAVSTADDIKDVILVETTPVDQKLPIPIRPLLIAHQKPKLIDDRGVIPPKYKCKHNRR